MWARDWRPFWPFGVVHGLGYGARGNVFGRARGLGQGIIVQQSRPYDHHSLWKATRTMFVEKSISLAKAAWLEGVTTKTASREKRLSTGDSAGLTRAQNGRGKRVAPIHPKDPEMYQPWAAENASLPRAEPNNLADVSSTTSCDQAERCIAIDIRAASRALLLAYQQHGIHCTLFQLYCAIYLVSVKQAELAHLGPRLQDGIRLGRLYRMLKSREMPGRKLLLD